MDDDRILKMDILMGLIQILADNGNGDWDGWQQLAVI